jgi:CRP-like cAMP-binding protein
MFLLSPEKLPAELLALVKHRDLAEGERLYYRGDRALAVFAVEKGRLNSLSQSSDGRPVTIYVARTRNSPRFKVLLPSLRSFGLQAGEVTVGLHKS